MKIFLSFLQSNKQHPIPAYDFWQYYLKNGIQEAGHQWVECPGVDWALGLVPQSKNQHTRWKQDAWGKTIEWLKKNPVDLFLGYLYPNQIDTYAIKEIQKSGIPCVNFFCDHVREFKSIPAQFKVFDLSWVPEHKAVKLYKKAGYPCINLPMPMWVEPQYRILKEETNAQVTFIGSKDIQRNLLFEDVILKYPDLALAIYGNGWKENEGREQPFVAGYTLNKKIKFNLDFIKSEGVVPFLRKVRTGNLPQTSSLLRSKLHASPSFEEYNTLTAESMITLGVNRYPSFRFPVDKPDSYSRLRDIEAPMLGACYLTEYTEGIEELYDIENEITVYKSEGDLVNKIKELETDLNKRKKLKVNGQKRALHDHTIPQSLNKILCYLNL